ncbi:InlB B-repeat-containing protein [Collinsella aerofaciens]|uniref:InlB B-repeat-containing protein n=1 Tax=Collinsella aerofaciens TaxID=74426 RepID=UPI00359C6C1F
MKSLTRTAYRAIAAFVAAAFVMIGLASPAFADGATVTITNQRTGIVYTDVATATKEATSGDTLVLGEGNYTLYNVSSTGTTRGKDLTFVGQGTDKTAWNIGALVPDPANFGTEYNGDYSFDGAGTVTFKNMTLRSGNADYLGFIRANKTVVDHCVINGKTFYWGYESAEFKYTTFNPPTGDYALWTYSSPVMTFDNCTFNATGKVINVYTDAAKQDITVNVNNCTFNSTKAAPGAKKHKQALKINDSNMGNYKYTLNITGINTGSTTVTAERDDITCSQLFGFGGETVSNSGRTDVNIDGKLVWTAGKMVTHEYTDGEHDNAYDVTYTNWAPVDAGTGTWTREVTKTCNYCHHKEGPTEESAYDLSYDLNGSKDKQTADFATVEHVAKTKVTADKPARKGYSFAGWNTAADGSGTSHEAGADIVLEAPVTLYAQWKKDEPAPKPSDNKPSDKPANKTKANKQDLPNTGDASANIVAAMGIMAIACFVASAVVSKVRK